MKIIAFEEHYTLPAIADAHPNSPRKLFDVSRGGRGWPPPGIEDLGEGRIAAMDAAGIDVQILSNVPGVEAVEVPQAVELARQANDAVVVAATEHPDRFLGFATLPMRDPDAAVAELERTVRDHHFVGALINGHVDGRYLDDQFFWPVFEAAETLGVPIYLHPTVPPRPVIDAYYQGLAPAVSAKLAVAGLGWHIDTGIHCVRLILGGVFDRFPKLQVIVGHHFEALSWMAWRTDYSFPPEESSPTWKPAGNSWSSCQSLRSDKEKSPTPTPNTCSGSRIVLHSKAFHRTPLRRALRDRRCAKRIGVRSE